MTLKIGILREEKSPPDRRVPLTPDQCKLLQQEHDVHILVQPSPIRAYTDVEYLAAGIELSEDMSGREVIFGVKEVPPPLLIENKTYLFFSHTIKEQPYNRGLLQTVLSRNIRLIDYECLTNQEGIRIIGFGHYAGLVGAYNAIRGFGLRTNKFDLLPAHKCHDKKEMEAELLHAKLPPIRIVITGSGRVAHGAMEIMKLAGIEKVDPDMFINGIFEHAVYTQLNSEDYHEHKDGKAWDTEDYYRHPENYPSTFDRFIPVTDILIHCTYWDPNGARVFTHEEMKAENFRPRIIADVTCDIDGSIPSTIRPSTIEDPYYGYNPAEESESDPYAEENIMVMAVDNLPCELPRDASQDFGDELVRNVIPAFLNGDKDGILKRATIAENGQLTEAYSYLREYVSKQP